MNELISVIVPVYNFENCLERCVNSILGQTYSKIELILIDDGSSDRSGSLCDKFRKKDSRVKVIHKENGGTSDARNKGLEAAQGEYIGFVDGDDFIEPDFYQILYELITKYETDISMVSYNTVKGDKFVPRVNSNDICFYDKEEGVRELLIDKNIQNYVWNKLYRRKLFAHIRFPVGVVFDDINIMYELFRETDNLVYLKTAKYNYCVREESIIHQKSHKKRESALAAVVKRFQEVSADFPQMQKYNAYAFVLWMIRMYSFTVQEDDSDDAFIKEHYNLFTKSYEQNSDFILEKLDPMKRIILFVMLWDMDKGKEIVKYLNKTKGM